MAWRKFDSLTAQEGFGRWACVIARYEVLKFQRARARDRFVLDDALMERILDESVEESRVRDQRLPMLERCLEKMPQSRRDLLLQAYSPGCTLRALAEQQVGGRSVSVAAASAAGTEAVCGSRAGRGKGGDVNARDLEMLDAWRHDRLSEAEFAVLQERLGKDAELRKALRALAEVEEGLSALATVRAQEQMTNTIEKVQPGSSRGAWLTWIIAALVSWGIAFFEYMIQVPANRMGHCVLNVGQLKILQEAVTLTVFVPFSILYMKEQIRLDYLWAGLCILGAVFFVFRQRLFGQ